ncbi:MAG: vWA domain-containing protein, partial [Cetobacterium sp.]
MAHFGTEVKTSRTTPTEWLKVGAQMGTLVNQWASRDDLVVYVGAEAAVDHGAPALYNPDSAEIEVNSAIAFGKMNPKHMDDINERATQFEFPAASGAILHEAMHARFSTWDIRAAHAELESTPEAFQALHLLEESRIEARGVRAMPENRSFLRACALDIVLGDMSDESISGMTQVRQVAHLLGLTYARVDAGVLDEEDVDPMRSIIEDTLPTEVVSALRAIWTEFQTLNPDYDTTRMYELAIKWAETVKEQSEAAGEPQPGEGGEGGEGSEGDMSGMARAMAQAIADALNEAAGDAAIGAQDEAHDQQTKEEYDARAQASKSDAEERASHEEMAAHAMGHSPSSAGSRSRLVEKRAPESAERIAAVRISKALERAKYRDRVRVETTSVIPPGRVRSRALVQGEAYRAQNVNVQTEPFQRVQHRHVDDPNLTVGVVVDISGSMGSAMQPMASAAWIMSEAVKRVQGRVAMTYYGNAVFPTLKPGEHLNEVHVYTADDGTENFDDAFRVTDGALNLLHGSGARLLVIVSDGHYMHHEGIAAKKWIQRCSQAGVAVLWVGAGHYGENGRVYVDK